MTKITWEGKNLFQLTVYKPSLREVRTGIGAEVIEVGTQSRKELEQM